MLRVLDPLVFDGELRHSFIGFAPSLPAQLPSPTILTLVSITFTCLTAATFTSIAAKSATPLAGVLSTLSRSIVAVGRRPSPRADFGRDSTALEHQLPSPVHSAEIVTLARKSK